MKARVCPMVSWCVNENLQLVDGMKFPHHTEKIQLNHYFCRSQQEIDQKLSRGWADYATGQWPRERFEVVNKLATYVDLTILQKLSDILGQPGQNVVDLLRKPEQAELLERMAELATKRRSAPLEFVPVREAGVRPSIALSADLKAQTLAATARQDYAEAIRLITLRLQLMPAKISLLVDLSVNQLKLGDPGAAWQALSIVWKLAPNSYPVLLGMAYFFLQVKDFEMAQKTCMLLLEMAPHNLMILGYQTETLIGLGRVEEALKLGLPLVELDDMLGELPKGMSDYLTKLLADTLLEKKDYDGAVRLWKARFDANKNDLHVLLELVRALLRKGDQKEARQRLGDALALDPHNEVVLGLLGMLT